MLAEAVLLKLFKHRDIVNGGVLYLRRYFITPRWFPIRIFLHRIYKPDPDRDLHDHPWDFTTIPIKGGYQQLVRLPGSVEYTTTMWRWRVAHNKAEFTHRIVSVEPNTWTLLFVRRARRMWGFWPEEPAQPIGRGLWVGPRYVFVPWREYLGLPASEPDSPEDA
jgi:hypothetical protein